jgi:pilus assembly protein CpaF
VFEDKPGLKPILDLLLDPEISEIMINGTKQVYVERRGVKQRVASLRFTTEQLNAMADAMVRHTNRAVNFGNPYVDVALEDGSRVNIVVPPLAVRGPTITIRKFSKSLKNLDDLVGRGTLDRRMADFLIGAVRGKLNIVFSGATGSGKTTTLNVLSSHIAGSERIVTLEDTVELVLNQEHVVQLECRDATVEGRGAVSMRDLFKNAMRMRPERIIVGEVRGGEAVDMIQAMCSGHRGTLGVLHAGSPRDVIARLEVMMLSSGLELPIWAMHRQIAQAIDLIVQHEQLVDGSRKLTRITEVRDATDQGIELADLFRFEHEGKDEHGKTKGRFVATGEIPRFLPDLKARWVELPEDMFRA